mgnify:CR=1 FL=1
MVSHENSSNGNVPEDSVNLWQSALAESEDKPSPSDSTELLRELQEDDDPPKDSVELLRQAYDENEAAEPSSRESDLAGLEKIEHRFARLRKFGDKLLGFFTKREIKDKTERREAQKQLAGKIGSAALETAKKTAAFAIETATKAAIKTALGE